MRLLTVLEAKKLAIRAALRYTKWNKVQAAKILQMSLRGLKYFVKKHGPL